MPRDPPLLVGRLVEPGGACGPSLTSRYAKAGDLAFDDMQAWTVGESFPTAEVTGTSFWPQLSRRHLFLPCSTPPWPQDPLPRPLSPPLEASIFLGNTEAHPLTCPCSP